MKILISAESTIDLPQELLDKYGIKTVPFGIFLGEELVADRFGISEEIYKYVEESKNLPKTSAIPPEEYRGYFEEIKKGYDAVIHISLSSMLSSSFNNARLAAEELADVYVVDSKTLSTGIALIAIKGAELVQKGKMSAKEIYEYLVEYTNKVQASFIIEKLTYLHKGGRCSALTLLGANLMKIKPQIILKDGRMTVGKKYIGSLNKVIGKYCDELLQDYPDPDLSHVFITHSSPMPEVQKVLKDKLKERGFKTIYDTLAGGTICSHCGPNTIGVLFVNN